MLGRGSQTTRRRTIVTNNESLARRGRKNRGISRAKSPIKIWPAGETPEFTRSAIIAFFKYFLASYWQTVAGTGVRVNQIRYDMTRTALDSPHPLQFTDERISPTPTRFICVWSSTRYDPCSNFHSRSVSSVAGFDEYSEVISDSWQGALDYWQLSWEKI